MPETVKIETAKEMGFCFGVRRAIDILQKAAKKYHRLETLGPVVHNRQVVDQLAQLGIVEIQDLAQLQGKIIAIPSHGAAPQLVEEIRAQGLQMVDTTCPIVQKAQRAASELAEAGFSVIIFGDADHPEVRGVLDGVGDKGLATLDAQEALNFARSGRIGIISQTTQSPAQFVGFVTQLISSLLTEVKELRIINTICDATRKRQAAALELAKKVELMIVIGGRNSANTRRLAEVSSSAGVETHHIETAKELNNSWLKNRRKIGITAGASTPDQAIEEVMAKLKEITLE